MTSLNLSVNRLQPDGVAAIEALFPLVDQSRAEARPSSLRALRISDNQLGDGLWKSVRRFGGLARLDVSRNQLSEANVLALAEVLAAPTTTLTELDLSYNAHAVTAGAARALFAATGMTRTLRHFNIAGCALTKSSFYDLCRLLACPVCPLNSLNMNSVTLDDDAMQGDDVDYEDTGVFLQEKLCAALRDNSSLTYLELFPTDIGLPAICAALRQNTSLRTLRLPVRVQNSNASDGDDTISLCQLARINSTLQHFDLLVEPTANPALWRPTDYRFVSPPVAAVNAAAPGAEAFLSDVAANAEAPADQPVPFPDACVWWPARSGVRQPLLNPDLTIRINQRVITPSKAARRRFAALFLPTDDFLMDEAVVRHFQIRNNWTRRRHYAAMHHIVAAHQSALLVAAVARAAAVAVSPVSLSVASPTWVEVGEDQDDQVGLTWRGDVASAGVAVAIDDDMVLHAMDGPAAKVPRVDGGISAATTAVGAGDTNRYVTTMVEHVTDEATALGLAVALFLEAPDAVFTSVLRWV